MNYVGVNVIKDKHEYFITNSVRNILFLVFTIQTNRDDFSKLFPNLIRFYEYVQYKSRTGGNWTSII